MDIDLTASPNTTLGTGGTKCQAHKISHNIGTLEVPHPHYQRIDNIQVHHHLAHE
jgi:hypothetical protein